MTPMTPMTLDEFEEVWNRAKLILEQPLDLFFGLKSENSEVKEEVLDRVYAEAKLHREYLVSDGSEKIPEDFWKGNSSGKYPGVNSILRNVLISYVYLNPDYLKDKDFLSKYSMIIKLPGIGDKIACKLLGDVAGIEVSPELISADFKRISGGGKKMSKGGKRVIEEERTNTYTLDSITEEFSRKYRDMILRYSYERILSVSGAEKVYETCMKQVSADVRRGVVSNKNIWLGDENFQGVLNIVVNVCADYLSDDPCQVEISETRTESSLPQVPDIYLPDLLGGDKGRQVNLYALFINHSLRDDYVRRIWLLLQMYGYGNKNADSDISEKTGIPLEEVQCLIRKAFTQLEKGVLELIKYL